MCRVGRDGRHLLHHVWAIEAEGEEHGFVRGEDYTATLVLECAVKGEDGVRAVRGCPTIFDVKASRERVTREGRPVINCVVVAHLNLEMNRRDQGHDREGRCAATSLRTLDAWTCFSGLDMVMVEVPQRDEKNKK